MLGKDIAHHLLCKDSFDTFCVPRMVFSLRMILYAFFYQHEIYIRIYYIKLYYINICVYIVLYEGKCYLKFITKYCFL